MFFKTPEESERFAKALGFIPNVRERRIHKEGGSTRGVKIMLSSRSCSTYELALLIAGWLGSFGSCLLWITEYGVWRRSENMHLYYKLRTSYQDYRSLPDAPGHLCLGHESADLVSFLDLAIQFGWGGFLVGTYTEVHLTLSHDEWVLVESGARLEQILREADQFALSYQEMGAGGRLDA
jgi:hypothetical protein